MHLGEPLRFRTLRRSSLIRSPHHRLIIRHSLALIICAFCLSFARIDQVFAQNQSGQLWVEGEYLIKYDEQKVQQLKRLIPGLDAYTNEEIKDALTHTLDASPKEDLPLINAQVVKADSNEINIDAAVDLLDSELAEYISPNFIYTANRVPNDPSYSTLWGMNQANDVDINAPEAWDIMNDDSASEIVVGIVDTGIDYNHPDLAANVWSNPLEANGIPGVDDDGNGVVDDIHGYNGVGNNGNPLDDNNHGTHCAGTIGGVGNNGVGVAGVAWKVKLMGLKFLDSSGSGATSNAIKVINYAVSMRNRGGKLKVLSNSWGGGGYSSALEDAIRVANDAGILFVAAAGNSGSNNDTTANYPSNYEVPNVLAVAAVDSNGAKASFSSYGATTVDVAAPGVGIYSTVRNNGYASFNGTSMATPHVSGVAALVFARVPQLSASDVRTQIMQTVKPLAGLNGLMIAPGIVNARAAIADPSNFPPDLTPIPNVTVNPVTRVKTVPVLATDRENDPLTYTAEVIIPQHQQAAAGLDRQYNLTAYQPQFDNFYRMSEKRLVNASNQTFFLMPDGVFYELVLPYLYYRVTINPLYYQDPNLLVDASLVDGNAFAALSLTPGTPAELRIEPSKNVQGPFSIAVSVSDGNRSDTENFTVTVQQAESCQ